MAWMELMANSRPRATQPESSKVTPKGTGLGRENQAAPAMPERSTIPAMSATAYPARMPRRMDASLQIPRPWLVSSITTARVKAAMAQFCQEP